MFSAADSTESQTARPTPHKGRSPKKPQPVSAADNPDALLELPCVETLVGLRKTAIYDKIIKGTFPPADVRRPKYVRWRALTITTWLRAQVAQQ